MVSRPESPVAISMSVMCRRRGKCLFRRSVNFILSLFIELVSTVNDSRASAAWGCQRLIGLRYEIQVFVSKTSPVTIDTKLIIIRAVFLFVLINGSKAVTIIDNGI